MKNNHYHLHNNIKLNSARNIIIILILLITIGVAIGVDSIRNDYLIIFLVPIFILAIINFVFLHYIYKNMVSMKSDYNQLTEFLQLKEKIGSDIKLPLNRGYAASPDFLNEVLETIEQIRPKRILEASCGISSISISEFLIKNNWTDVEHIALEHDEFYWKECNEKIRNDKSQIIHAPIKEYSIEGKSWKWYDIEKVKDFENIDLIIIDGPPAYLQKLSRYPALPLLHQNLSPNCVVLLDDCYRPQEQTIASRWAESYNFNKKILYSEKGIGKLTPK